jgi:hypothetical protein
MQLVRSISCCKRQVKEKIGELEIRGKSHRRAGTPDVSTEL